MGRSNIIRIKIPLLSAKPASVSKSSSSEMNHMGFEAVLVWSLWFVMSWVVAYIKIEPGNWQNHLGGLFFLYLSALSRCFGHRATCGHLQGVAFELVSAVLFPMIVEPPLGISTPPTPGQCRDGVMGCNVSLCLFGWIGSFPRCYPWGRCLCWSHQWSLAKGSALLAALCA